MTMICRKLWVGLEGMLLRMHEREKISANDAEHAADGGSDQALQAHSAQPPLKHDDSEADQQTDACGFIGGQAKRMNEETNDSDDEDKQKAYEYDVHVQYLSRGRHRSRDSRPRRPFRVNDSRTPGPAFY